MRRKRTTGKEWRWSMKRDKERRRLGGRGKNEERGGGRLRCLYMCRKNK